ncbi:hypothetical protein [uncultured Treponema sp.]|uniref:hypothetical protein n=1 Tax=uncultured Treponema sp. TaxID=162155 RepID=UPI0035A6545B
MKKLIFSILPAFLFAFISCMNMSSGSGENGSVRVALPGNSRAAYNKDNADKFTVRLYNDDFDKTEEGALGGVLEFEDLEPGTYTAEAEAWNTSENLLEGSGSAEIKVKAGETSECTIKMILEGIFYSKYMLFSDYSGNMYVSDYPTCTEKKKEGFKNNNPCLYFAEGNDGCIYYVKQYYDTSKSALGNYRSYKYDLNTSTPEYIEITQSNQNFFDGCYDSTTDIYWVARKNYDGYNYSLYLYKGTDEYNTGITNVDFKNCVIRGKNLYYSSGTNPIGYATFDYTTGAAIKITEKPLSYFGVSGKVTDMAVLEDGTVAVLIRDANVSSSYDMNTPYSVTDTYNVANNGTVTSRGALILLSSDLSTYKVYGWTDSSRTISATGSSSGYDVQLNSITAYIPEYEERNSHFYGPMRIVAVRPKELVIADCGANFVLPDYSAQKNGKMYAHNRLMTVNLRNFAIGCKKEFSESEIKFQNLDISGSLTVVSNWSDGVEK